MTWIVAILFQFYTNFNLIPVFESIVLFQCVDIRRLSIFLHAITLNKKFYHWIGMSNKLNLNDWIVAIFQQFITVLLYLDLWDHFNESTLDDILFFHTQLLLIRSFITGLGCQIS